MPAPRAGRHSLPGGAGVEERGLEAGGESQEAGGGGRQVRYQTSGHQCLLMSFVTGWTEASETEIQTTSSDIFDV